VHGVSNAVLNTPWLKMQRAKELFSAAIEKGMRHGTDSQKQPANSNGSTSSSGSFQQALNQPQKQDIIEALFSAFSDDTRGAAGTHPDTGVGPEWEERLSSVFVRTEQPLSYGTRSQTVILVDTNDNVTFVERTRKLASLLVLPEENHPSVDKTVLHSSCEVTLHDGSTWLQSQFDFSLSPGQNKEP